jgi:hypothetical protein
MIRTSWQRQSRPDARLPDGPLAAQKVPVGSQTPQQHRRRRRRREDRKYFEFAEDKPSDPQEQRSIAMLVLSVLAIVLIICAMLIFRSMELETFPGM